MKPLASTIRTVEWDELPARAREIPFGFNPFAEGVLMAHQVECLKFDVSILAIPKGRRTGITFALGLNSTLIAGAQKVAGGDNVYYIGDTKEKGLEFIGYVAKFARVIAAQQAEGVSAIEEFLFEDPGRTGQYPDDCGLPCAVRQRVSGGGTLFPTCQHPWSAGRGGY